MTVTGFDYRKTGDPNLADPVRPVFAVNGVPVEIGGFPEAKNDTARGCDTAYVNTWACGPLRPGRERTMRWSVTAVKAGGRTRSTGASTRGSTATPRRCWRTAATRSPGTFTGRISATAPDVRIADDGETVISGDR